MKTWSRFASFSKAIKDLLYELPAFQLSTKEARSMLIELSKKYYKISPEERENVEKLLKKIKRAVKVDDKKDENEEYEFVIDSINDLLDDLANWREFNIDATDEDNSVTPLMTAASSGNSEACKLLIIEWSNPNASDEFGFSILMRSAWIFNPKIVELLLEAWADPNYQNKNWKTALMIASWIGNNIVVECLLKAWADQKAQDVEWRTASNVAEMLGFTEIVKLLKKKYKVPIKKTNKNKK